MVLRVVKWTAAFVGVALALTAVILYWQACQTPEDYVVAPLNDQERQAATNDFTSSVLLRFHNAIEDMEPFTWTLTQEQINAYLASLDDIVATWPSGRPGQGSAAMERAGLAEPRVSIADGRVRLMVRLTRYDKVLSADLGVALAADNRVHVEVQQAMVGRVRVPASIVSRWTGSLHELAQRTRGEGPPPQGREGNNVGPVIAEILDGIAGQDITQSRAWPRVLVDRIELADGAITLHVIPQPRYKARPRDLPF